MNSKRSIMVAVAAVGLLAVGTGTAAASSAAAGAATNSPGFLSGNFAQIPVHIPVNVCGNTVDVIGLLNPAFGNHCENNG